VVSNIVLFDGGAGETVRKTAGMHRSTHFTALARRDDASDVTVNIIFFDSKSAVKTSLAMPSGRLDLQPFATDALPVCHS